MIRKAIQMVALAAVSGVFGCGMMGGNKQSTAATMPSTTMPAGMMTDKQSLMEQANAMLKKGEDLLAKGKADNSSEEQSQGQSLIDQAKQLLEKAKGMMN